MEQLEQLNFTAYLPLRKEVRQWKDRLKKVEVPLFSSYVFVKIDDKEYLEIPKLIKGFVKFVTIGGQRVVVREAEIENIKRLIEYSEGKIQDTNQDFSLNEKVQIKTGKLRGLQGRLVEFRGKYKIAIQIESIRSNLLVEINKNAVEKVN